MTNGTQCTLFLSVVVHVAMGMALLLNLPSQSASQVSAMTSPPSPLMSERRGQSVYDASPTETDSTGTPLKYTLLWGLINRQRPHSPNIPQDSQLPKSQEGSHSVQNPTGSVSAATTQQSLYEHSSRWAVLSPGNYSSLGRAHSTRPHQEQPTFLPSTQQQQTSLHDVKQPQSRDVTATHISTTQQHMRDQSTASVTTQHGQENSTASVTTQHGQDQSTASVTTQQYSLDHSTVSITTEDVLGCLDSSHPTLRLEADEVWLSVDYTGNTSGSSQLRKPSTCWLQVRGRSHGIVSLLIFNETCFTHNRLVVHSTMRNRDNYNCDPMAWMAPGVDLTMTSNSANVSIGINDISTPFSLLAQFKIVPERRDYELEIREVTQYLGFIQTSNWTEEEKPNKCWDTSVNTTYHLDGPRSYSVMFSMSEMDIKMDVSWKTCPEDIAIYQKTNGSICFLLWRICHQGPMVPFVSRADGFAVSFLITPYTCHAMFRLQYSFHKVSKWGSLFV